MASAPSLSAGERERYARHLALQDFGAAGQEKLKQASVLVVGAGGLGSPAALYLAAAGIGRLGLVDFDRVDLSNLQRQVLFDTRDVARPKAEVARARLAALNPEIAIEAHALRLTADNAMELLGRYDIVVDGTDRLATRYLVNDACVLLGKPLVAAAIHRFEGQAMTYVPGRGPCYRCLFPESPDALVPNCAEAGVLGVLPGVMGSLQATEAIKLVTGIGAPLVGRLLVYDALDMRFEEFQFARDPQCAVCGDRPTIRTPGGLAAPEGTMQDIELLSATDLIARLRSSDDTPALRIVDVREPHEWEAGRLPGSQHIPLGSLPSRIGEVPVEGLTVFVCAGGMRSMQACRFAAQRGLRTANLEGGLAAVYAEQPALFESDAP